ncbi:hypothetical protein MKX03_016033, partial [Papaver bracteatum]
GLSLVRKAGELHYDELIKQKKVHAAVSYQLERENEKLKRQIDILRARERKADNALKLMRRQRDRANFKANGLGGYAATPRDAGKTDDDVVDELYDPVED